MKTSLVHATAVAHDGVAALLRGPSGAGKSDLALRLIDQGWQLIADDQTEVQVEDGRLMARAPQSIAGKIEVYGLGIFETSILETAPIVLVVDLIEATGLERFPEDAVTNVQKYDLPLVALDPFHVTTPVKLGLALKRAAAQLGVTGTGQSAGHLSQKQHRPASLVLITGLSGAGRSTALKALEDIGFEAIDNLPLDFMQRLLDGDGPSRSIAVGIDTRTRNFDPIRVLNHVEALAGKPGLSTTLVFLDCDTEVLQRRFTETRRRHPLAEDRPIIDGITAERQQIAPLRERSDLVVDTSVLRPNDLRQVLAGHLGRSDGQTMAVSVMSFSYRVGLPREADLVFDARFLSNPHYQPDLKNMTGRDKLVIQYIQGDKSYAPFLKQTRDLLHLLLPRFEESGKSYLTIAVGCTGGRHRSVAVAEALAEWLDQQGFKPGLLHRDLEP